MVIKLSFNWKNAVYLNISMEVEVEEEEQDASSVEDQSPMHPLRKVASNVQGIDGMKHPSHKLYLNKPFIKYSFTSIYICITSGKSGNQL